MRVVVYNEKSGLVSHHGVDGFLAMLGGDENVPLRDFLHGNTPKVCAKDVLVTAGGDGTLRAVIEKLTADGAPCDELPAVCIIPGGSSNSVARSLRLPKHPRGWKRLLSKYKTVRADLGMANGRPFILCVSAGVSARAVGGAERSRGTQGSSVPHYVLATLFAMFKYEKITARTSGGNAMTGPEIIVANMPVFGGFFHLPKVSPFDGLLDVFAPMPWNMLSWFVHGTGRGRCFTAGELVLEGDGEYQLDGEPGGMLPVRISTSPARIRLAVPA